LARVTLTLVRPAAEVSYTYVQGNLDLLSIQPSVVAGPVVTAAAAASLRMPEAPPAPTFTLHPDPMNFADAEAACNLDGGHLAYYDSLEQQTEVGLPSSATRAP
jgi:hypothetical protein